jgi:hypothetical protein
MIWFGELHTKTTRPAVNFCGKIANFKDEEGKAYTNFCPIIQMIKWKVLC